MVSLPVAELPRESTRVGASESFRYRAVRGDGRVEEGTVHARHRDDAAAVLTGRGLFPVEVHEIGTGLSAAAGRRLSGTDLAIGLRTLATLLEAGLPVGRALSAFGDVAPKGWTEAIPLVSQAVREGQSLAAALDAAPVRIPPVIVGIIRAGESAGRLSASVQRAAELAERNAELRSRLRAALAYPMLLAVVGAGTMILLVTVVIPRFALVLAELGQALPTSTRMMLVAAGAMRVAALPALMVIALAYVIWRRWTADGDGRRRWHEVLLRVPLVGAVRFSSGCARISSSVAELLDSGTPLPRALQQAAAAAGDAALQVRMLAARDRLLHGFTLAAALEAERALPAAASKLVRTGEESGRLAAMLRQAARVEGSRAETTIMTALKLVEPLLLIVFGGLAALVAAALLQAVYAVRVA